MDAARHILVVDDDAPIRRLLEEYLRQHGYLATAVTNARAMDKYLQRHPCDLLVLDLLLPEEDGLAICRRLRAGGSTVPIVMLTAKGSDADRILGLEIGADDYLPKPFNPAELLARIRAVLRRAPRAVPGAPAPEPRSVAFGRFTLNLLTRELAEGDASTSLTTGDFALLKTFATHPHQPLSREKLAQLARSRTHEPLDRNIDVRVARLRKLIERDSNRPRYIQTVWGFGYVFVPDGDGA